MPAPVIRNLMAALSDLLFGPAAPLSRNEMMRIALAGEKPRYHLTQPGDPERQRTGLRLDADTETVRVVPMRRKGGGSG